MEDKDEKVRLGVEDETGVISGIGTAEACRLLRIAQGPLSAPLPRGR